MKRLLPVVFYLSLATVLSACTQESRSIDPYQAYQQAYQQLNEVDSFATKTETVTIVMGNPDDVETSYEDKLGTVCQMVHSDNGDLLVGHYVMKGGSDNSLIEEDLYFKDGYAYYCSKDENVCYPQDATFAMKAATGELLDFPENIIVGSAATETEDGVLLSFELDPEGFYAWLYPDVYKEYGYGEFMTYGEPISYTVQLTTDGFISRVNKHLYLLNTDEKGTIHDYTATVVFTQYGGIKLDFPDLTAFRNERQ